MTIHDIAPNGTWVVTRDDTPSGIRFRAAGSDTDVDLSWLDSALGPVLSGDGKTLFFTDQSSTGGANYGVAMRPTAGGPIVRLGEGNVQQVSTDGTSALVTVPSTPPRLMTYPVGTGQAVRLDHGEFENLSDAAWLPDGKQVLVSGNFAGQPSRCFILDPTAGELKPVGPEGILEGHPSPDGKTFIARTKTGWSTFPLAGDGGGKPVDALTPDDYLIRWNLDGSAVFVFHRNEIPTPVERVDPATGKRQTIMMLSDRDRAGRVSILTVSMADDLRSVAYATWNYTSVLFTVTTRP
jgi:dipeptidyl aminopeptidase/acylaminoacyl peptidase